MAYSPIVFNADGSVTRPCADCGTSFTLGYPEQQFYQSKELSLPKRCKRCRDARTQAREIANGV